MPRSFLALLVFATLAGGHAHAQQMPAPVDRPLAPMPPAAPVLPPPPGLDFKTTGQLASMAPTVTAVMGLAPSATIMVKASPTVSVKPYVRPAAAPQLTLRSTGPGRYIILPQESPLATAPMATLSAAGLVAETETALPEVWQETPLQTTQLDNGELTVQSHLQTVPTQPESGIMWEPAPQASPAPAALADRLTQLADKLEGVSRAAEDMDARLAAAESASAVSPTSANIRQVPPTSPQLTADKPPLSPKIPQPPAPLKASVPYVNDAVAPGPAARKALDKLAAEIRAAAVAPASLTVAATVAVPPFAAEGAAKQLARARHLAAWNYLNAKLKPAGLKLPGTGNKLTIATTTNPAAQTQRITVNY